MDLKTLKQLFREEGFAVNRDDQKGIGNKAIEDQQKVYRRWLTQFKENELICPSKQYYYSNSPQDMQELGKKNILIMLLTELGGKTQ